MIDGFKMAGTILRQLAPPSLHANGDTDLVEKSQLYDKRVKRWRWVVFYSIMVLAISLFTDVVLTWGYEPYVKGSFVPIAEFRTQMMDSRDSLKENKDRVKRIELQLLEGSLLSTRVTQCKTTDKSYLTGVLTKLRQDYFIAAGYNWPMPQCNEVIP